MQVDDLHLYLKCRWPASLLKMSLFHSCFSHILLEKTIHLVFPSVEHGLKWVNTYMNQVKCLNHSLKLILILQTITIDDIHKNIKTEMFLLQYQNGVEHTLIYRSLIVTEEHQKHLKGRLKGQFKGLSLKATQNS